MKSKYSITLKHRLKCANENIDYWQDRALKAERILERRTALLRTILHWLAETVNPNRMYGVKLISEEIK